MRASKPDMPHNLGNRFASGALARYFSILQKKKLAKFLVAKKLAANWTQNGSLTELWTEHARCANEFRGFEKGADEDSESTAAFSTEYSYFGLKVEITRRILQSCHFCARRCGVNRRTGSLGYCCCGKDMVVSSIFAHMGEEPELIPSGTIFTLGCTIRCHHCQNWSISQWKEDGASYTAREMAKEVEQLHLSGCRNANLVGGEPTPWLHNWLETFQHVNANLPVVWNSNSYYSEETAELLDGFADVYLLDFKYGPGDCARRISDAPDYWHVCTRNHLEARKYGELIVRVLVLPGHIDCCTAPILEWISQNLGHDARVNLMFQYRPEWRAHELPELRRRLTNEEIASATSTAKKANLANLVV